MQEAQHLKSLAEQEQVVGLHGVGTLVQADGYSCPAPLMERLHGVDLDTLLRLHRPLPAGLVAELLLPVAELLRRVGSSSDRDGATPYRMIHGDIKPANLMLTTNGRVTVLDFGIEIAGTTRGGAQPVGIEAYQAPERFEGSATTTSSIDIFALGMTAAFALTNRAPARPPTDAMMYERWMRSWERDLFGQSVPAEMGQFLLRCLAFLPGERPTAADVRDHCLRFRSLEEGAVMAFVDRAVRPHLLERSQLPANGLWTDTVVSLESLKVGPSASVRNEYIQRPNAERRASHCLGRPGTPVVVHGPCQGAPQLILLGAAKVILHRHPRRPSRSGDPRPTDHADRDRRRGRPK